MANARLSLKLQVIKTSWDPNNTQLNQLTNSVGDTSSSIFGLGHAWVVKRVEGLSPSPLVDHVAEVGEPEK